MGRDGFTYQAINTVIWIRFSCSYAGAHVKTGRCFTTVRCKCWTRWTHETSTSYATPGKAHKDWAIRTQPSQDMTVMTKHTFNKQPTRLKSWVPLWKSLSIPQSKQCWLDSGNLSMHKVRTTGGLELSPIRLIPDYAPVGLHGDRFRRKTT